MPQEICEIREVETCLMDLLHAIQKADIAEYRKRVSKDVSCFEPETRGHLLRGIELHALLVEKSDPVAEYHIELVDPVIRVNGNMAYAAYSLHLTELEDKEETISTENVTRIFEKRGTSWKMAHFHRSQG